MEEMTSIRDAAEGWHRQAQAVVASPHSSERLRTFMQPYTRPLPGFDEQRSAPVLTPPAARAGRRAAPRRRRGSRRSAARSPGRLADADEPPLDDGRPS